MQLVVLLSWGMVFLLWLALALATREVILEQYCPKEGNGKGNRPTHTYVTKIDRRRARKIDYIYFVGYFNGKIQRIDRELGVHVAITSLAVMVM